MKSFYAPRDRGLRKADTAPGLRAAQRCNAAERHLFLAIRRFHVMLWWRMSVVLLRLPSGVPTYQGGD
jgi:hypothetical protein